MSSTAATSQRWRRNYGGRRRLTAAERAKRADAALQRAQTGQALTNFPAIFEACIARGIPEADILPRENVFTFEAWKALGRHVRKGEKGIAVLTWIERPAVTEQDPSSGEERETQPARRFPKTTYVFHISQTDANA